MFRTESSADKWSRSRSYNMSIASVKMEVTQDTIEDIDELNEMAAFADITLTYFQSSLYATVLEDVLAQLYILEECNNPTRVAKTMSEMVVLLAKKYSVPKRTDGDELDDIDPKRLNCMEYKMQKLESDRKYLRDILVGTYKDLSLKRRSRFLRNSVDEVVDGTRYREHMIKDEAGNRILRREMNRQLRHQRNHIKTLYYDTDAVIQDLRTRVEDASLNSHIRGRYVENWQNARAEQHLQTISNKESKPLESIMLYKQRADQEQRVHSEVELLTNIAINDIDELNEMAAFADITLTYFQSSLYATVLEDVLAQLYILEECNNPTRVAKTMSEMVVLLAKKYSVPKRTDGDELDDIDPKRLNCMEYKMQKLESDRKYLRDILVGTYKDLSLKRRSRFLRNSVDEVVDGTRYREHMIKDEAGNRILRREMNRQLRHQRNHIKTLYYDTDAVIQDLRTRVEDASLNSHIRGRYVENWQNARAEQHLQTISNKESKPLESIMLYKQRADQEQRVHSEVELLTNIAINETLQKVEQWMNKYDKDIEAIDLKIQKKKNQYEDMQMKTANLEKMIEEHSILIKNWVIFKEEREQARLYREKMNNAAVTVQAWWRGLLVRNQLGPYKPVKKKPPPPTEGKKKKK